MGPFEMLIVGGIAVAMLIGLVVVVVTVATSLRRREPTPDEIERMKRDK